MCLQTHHTHTTCTHTFKGPLFPCPFAHIPNPLTNTHTIEDLYAAVIPGICPSCSSRQYATYQYQYPSFAVELPAQPVYAASISTNPGPQIPTSPTPLYVPPGTRQEIVGIASSPPPSYHSDTSENVAASPNTDANTGRGELPVLAPAPIAFLTGSQEPTPTGDSQQERGRTRERERCRDGYSRPVETRMATSTSTPKPHHLLIPKRKLISPSFHNHPSHPSHHQHQYSPSPLSNLPLIPPSTPEPSSPQQPPIPTQSPEAQARKNEHRPPPIITNLPLPKENDPSTSSSSESPQSEPKTADSAEEPPELVLPIFPTRFSPPPARSKGSASVRPEGLGSKGQNQEAKKEQEPRDQQQPRPFPKRTTSLTALINPLNITKTTPTAASLAMQSLYEASKAGKLDRRPSPPLLPSSTSLSTSNSNLASNPDPTSDSTSTSTKNPKSKQNEEKRRVRFGNLPIPVHQRSVPDPSIPVSIFEAIAELAANLAEGKTEADSEGSGLKGEEDAKPKGHDTAGETAGLAAKEDGRGNPPALDVDPNHQHLNVDRKGEREKEAKTQAT
ncbi:hypothetical protein G7Y89_g10181 [Cudoniella acicularis]|uniref:Uncharacterized protein n=1 Tax=Cudoniella acicularis TaxID=354080 RepID=A0A8H4VZA8_9HELO|nr:hypothetical protein G7Y89_g10181 [Cudoniella acicularis]